MYSMQTQVNLHRPSERATTVKVVRGTIPARCWWTRSPSSSPTSLWRPRGPRRQVGTTQFDIEDVTEMPGKQYQIKMAITEDLKDNPNDYSWVNSLYQRIEVQDEKGDKMQIFGQPLDEQHAPTTSK